MMECKHHGITEFYTRPNGHAECLVCRRISQAKVRRCERYRAKNRKWTNAHRRTKLGNYEHRLRSLLRYATNGRSSYTKDLPYSSQQLCIHLEFVRNKQGNRCPICHKSYDIVGYDIDHIIPVSSAKTKKELLSLFNLENLSFLCPKCNRHIKGNRLDIKYE